MDEKKKGTDQQNEGYWWNRQQPQQQQVQYEAYDYGDDGASWKKPLIIAGVVIAAVLLVGIGALALVSHIHQTEEMPVAEEETETSVSSDVYLTVTAEGADGSSTPCAVGVLSSSDSEEEQVFTIERVELAVDERVRLGNLEEGSYSLRVLETPVNGDGSTYMAPVFDMGFEVGGTGEAVELSLQLEPSAISADEVYEWANPLIGRELKAAFDTIAEKGFTATYTLADGTDRTAKVNSWKKKNFSGATVLEVTNVNTKDKTLTVVYEKAAKSTSGSGEDSTAKSSEDSSSVASSGSTGGSEASGTSSSGSSSSDSSSSSSSSGSSSGSSSSTHTHNWVAQTETVHHDAKYRTVKHAAVKENHIVCDECGEDFGINNSTDLAAWSAHKKSTGHSSMTVKTVTVQKAYKEKVLVRAAYDEEVVTGYKCSGCGATKSAD